LESCSFYRLGRKNNMLDNEEIKNQLLSEIEDNGMIMLCVTKEGDVIMLTTGDFTPVQTSIAEKILTVIGDHSIIFRMFLYLEILFSRLLLKISSKFRRN